MELTPEVAGKYVRLAFEQMLTVADRLGDDRVNERPLGPATNAVAAIVAHCCGVSEFWLGHVGLGRESIRSREDEFRATATVGELHDLVAATLAQVEAASWRSRRAPSRPTLRAECSSSCPKVTRPSWST